jgi:glutathione S-transferase
LSVADITQPRKPAMADLVFYHAAPSRGSVVHWMLEEVGEPYDVHLLNLKSGDQNKPEYRAINPQGKVPAIRHKGVVTTEVAAICCYLADAFPAAKLAIPVGDPRRGPYLQWLFFSPSCIEPAMLDRGFPRVNAPPPTAVGYRDLDALLDIVCRALKQGPYLMGEQFTAVDVVVGSTLRWGMMFKMIPERLETRDYVARLASRPAMQRANAKDAAAMAT